MNHNKPIARSVPLFDKFSSDVVEVVREIFGAEWKTSAGSSLTTCEYILCPMQHPQDHARRAEE